MLIEDEVDHRSAGLGWSLRVRRWSHRISGSAWWHAAAMVAAILAASAMVIYTVAVVLQLHVVLPVWDEWAWVSDLRQIWDGAYDWSDLIHPHNEHRIFFPRLIMLADASLFRMGGWSVLVTTFLLQAANAGVLIRSMTQIVKGAAPRVLLGSLVILVLFSLRQRDNLDNVFQVQFVGVFTAAIVAITFYSDALARQAEGSRGAAARPFIVAALSCTVATYTMANGVMTGFVLVVLAILVRAAWLTVLATLVAAVILAAAFFYHYSPLGTRRPWPTLSRMQAGASRISWPIWATRSAPSFLSPKSSAGSGCWPCRPLPGSCSPAGQGPLPPSRSWAWQASSSRPPAPPSTVERSLGIGQALESRYVTPASLFWCAMVCFWSAAAPRVAPRRGRVLGNALVTMAAVVLAVASVWFEWTARPEMRAQAATFRQFHDSLLSGLYDAPLTARFEIWPDEEVRISADFLRTARLSLFAEREAAALGQRVTDLGSVSDPKTCTGGITVAEADPQLGQDGVRLKGTAHDEAHRADVGPIFLTDSDGFVVGYGSVDRPDGPPREWLGYARLRPGADVQAYGAIRDGRICRIGAATVRTP